MSTSASIGVWRRFATAAGLAAAVLIGAGVGAAAAQNGSADEQPERDRPPSWLAPERDAELPAVEAGVVRVAMLRYGTERKTSVCFSAQFLGKVRLETDINVSSEFARIDLAGDELFEHPFAIMTGEGAFDLTDEESDRLRAYVTGGGFLLASAGCSNRSWAASMREAIARALPEWELTELSPEHPAFQTIFAVKDFMGTKHGREARLLGIEIDGRLALIFTPQGLNDTRNAERGCCCCGGNELRNAQYINANVLAYALMR